MKIENANPNGLSVSQPLPHSEMAAFVKKNIHYADICNRVGQGELNGDPALLDRIVHLVVDIQYSDGNSAIETIAHQVLQLRQYEVEYVLDRLRRCPAEKITDQFLLEMVYSAVGSIGAHRYAAKHKLKTT